MPVVAGRTDLNPADRMLDETPSAPRSRRLACRAREGGSKDDQGAGQGGVIHPGACLMAPLQINFSGSEDPCLAGGAFRLAVPETVRKRVKIVDS